MDDLHQLPRFDENLSYLYLEHGVLDRHEKAVAFHDKDGIIPIPVASLNLLMLGPGMKVTHAAVSVLADNNCLAVWCGEEGVRFYAVGMGGTRGGSGMLFYNAANEQGYQIHTFGGTSREVANLEGLHLIRIPQKESTLPA